jgi:hypothetical protein
MNEQIAATRSIIVERLIPHPPEKIWRALTQAHLIEQWLMKNDFEPRLGVRFTFQAKPMGRLERYRPLRGDGVRSAAKARLFLEGRIGKESRLWQRSR